MEQKTLAEGKTALVGTGGLGSLLLGAILMHSHGLDHRGPVMRRKDQDPHADIRARGALLRLKELEEKRIKEAEEKATKPVRFNILAPQVAIRIQEKPAKGFLKPKNRQKNRKA